MLPMSISTLSSRDLERLYDQSRLLEAANLLSSNEIESVREKIACIAHETEQSREYTELISDPYRAVVDLKQLDQSEEWLDEALLDLEANHVLEWRTSQRISCELLLRSAEGIEPSLLDEHFCEVLNLSVRVRNLLESSDRFTLADLLRSNADDLFKIPRFREAAHNEVRNKLSKLGLKLRGD